MIPTRLPGVFAGARDLLWSGATSCPPHAAQALSKSGDAHGGWRLQLSLSRPSPAERAFGFGMIADFQAALDTHGPWFYASSWKRA
ncbi:MAG: hypothetical protein M5U33_12100 [Pseudorhodoplanes sp.]|nr:hypothetical protein [Pseudorhodoplanes sp.]